MRRFLIALLNVFVPGIGIAYLGYRRAGCFLALANVFALLAYSAIRTIDIGDENSAILLLIGALYSFVFLGLIIIFAPFLLREKNGGMKSLTSEGNALYSIAILVLAVVSWGVYFLDGNLRYIADEKWYLKYNKSDAGFPNVLQGELLLIKRNYYTQRNIKHGDLFWLEDHLFFGSFPVRAIDPSYIYASQVNSGSRPADISTYSIDEPQSRMIKREVLNDRQYIIKESRMTPFHFNFSFDEELAKNIGEQKTKIEIQLNIQGMGHVHYLFDNRTFRKDSAKIDFIDRQRIRDLPYAVLYSPHIARIGLRVS
ncbi:hypothetical protein V6B08_20600 [Ferrovibrio sp. MS7]|uniref:hypothetical protein n=1 Tax=Ferrovibrio plantarum TaxID=3119164 RepID=UPI0031370B63